MGDMDRWEESLKERDREMLENLRLHFTREPGSPRSWEELPEASRQQIRRLYWESMEGESKAG